MTDPAILAKFAAAVAGALAAGQKPLSFDAFMAGAQAPAVAAPSIQPVTKPVAARGHWSNVYPK